MSNDKDRIIEILNDRIADAYDNLRALPVDHPMADEKWAYLKSLNDLKADLMREGLITRIEDVYSVR